MPPASKAPSFLNLALLLGNPEAALDEEFWEKACELRVAVPAVVVAFDSEKQVVQVQPAIQDVLRVNAVPTSMNLPLLSNVPVMMPRGGGFSITLPLQAGDEGVVIFSDMAIDSWWQSGGTQNPQVERRRHDLSDGMFFPAGWSQPRVLPGYSTGQLQIRSDDGATVIEVGAGAVTVVAASIKLQGNVEVTGELTADGSVFLHGTEYLTHKHTGVTTGSGDTGPVF